MKNWNSVLVAWTVLLVVIVVTCLFMGIAIKTEVFSEKRRETCEQCTDTEKDLEAVKRQIRTLQAADNDIFEALDEFHGSTYSTWEE